MIQTRVFSAIVGETGEGAVAGERPGAAAFDGNGRVVADGGASLGVVQDVDGAGEAAAVFQGHGQIGDGILRQLTQPKRDGAAVYGRDLTREGLAESISLRSY